MTPPHARTHTHSDAQTHPALVHQPKSDLFTRFRWGALIGESFENLYNYMFQKIAVQIRDLNGK